MFTLQLQSPRQRTSRNPTHQFLVSIEFHLLVLSCLLEQELGLNFLTLFWFSSTFQMHSEFPDLIPWQILKNLTMQQSSPATSFLGPKVLTCVLLHHEKFVKESKAHSTTRTLCSQAFLCVLNKKQAREAAYILQSLSKTTK